MARKTQTKNGVVLIADVGTPSTRLLFPENKTFAEKVKECLAVFLRQRIFLNESNDDVAIILCGSQKTENQLDYKNIEILQPMEKVSWKMIEHVDTNFRTSNCEGDWMDALGVALDVIHTTVELKGTDYNNTTIVYFTAFDSPSRISKKSQQAYIAALSSKRTKLFFIGSNVNEASLALGKGNFNQSELTALHLVDETEGGFYDFENYFGSVLPLTSQPKQGSPWNVTLDIGSNIKIPVSGYIKVEKSTSLKWKEETIEDETQVEKERTYQKQVSNAVVDKEDVIVAYMYGTKPISVPRQVDEQYSYKSGNKCLSVLAFVNPVRPEYLMEAGTKYFFAQSKAGIVDRSAQIALSALIHAMEETGKVAIVRRVYRQDLKLTIGVLSPRIKLKYECLVFHELPFSDDWREFEFAPIITPKYQPTFEQLEIIDRLIDNLDLTKGEKEDDPLDSCENNDPYEEYLRHVIAVKALHPDDPLTEDIPEHIKMTMNPSPQLMKNSIEVLERIKHLFPLEVASRSKRNKSQMMKEGVLPATSKEEPEDENVVKKTRLDESGEIDLMSILKADVVKVGPVNPVQDFLLLLETGKKPIEKIYEEMADMVMKLVRDSGGTNKSLMTKAQSCIQVFRKHAKEEGQAIEYNRWMECFKEQVNSEYFGDFWKSYICESRLGLITLEESPVSNVTKQQADQFLQPTVTTDDLSDTLYDEELLALL